MASGYLRSRVQRRWTSQDVADATQRLEKAFAKDKTARAIASMHKARAVRGKSLLPVTRDEIEVCSIIPPEPKQEHSGVFGGFSFRLPWAPSVNTAYFNKTGGGRAKTKKSVLFLNAVGSLLAAQKVPFRKLSHPMAIYITQHTSTSAGDVDNGIKLALDSLKHWGVIADDNRKIVKRVTVEDGSRVPKGSEHIEVRIECLQTISP
jgi:Holliday junction resolvase RusA-like endonuclease